MSLEAHGRREVRRVHIIYFISRKGRIDQPHLLRVHHFCGNGVRLRDIKRWLAVVRGEDMPESYSWSYKRRYKTGYVWQDSLDEDLITPISDNEYVIQGSEFCSAASDYDDSSVAIYHEESSNVEANKSNDQSSEATQMDGETKQLIDIHEAPITKLINDSAKDNEETKHLISRNEEDYTMKTKRNDVRFCLNFLKKNKNTKSKKIHVKLPSGMPDSSASTLKCSPKKNARNLFRKMITCGMMDTPDSAIKAMREASQ